MANLFKRAAANFPHWTDEPIPNFELATGGLIALADLGTIAQRTRIVGGSSWLDVLLLAPGLHYQQAADALSKEQQYAAIEQQGEGENKSGTQYNITNPATLHYLQSVANSRSNSSRVTVDVGDMPQDYYYNYHNRNRQRNSRAGQELEAAEEQHERSKDLGWLSHILYLASPVLTIASMVFTVLLQDWWALGLLCALMTSRILNIWVIKQRINPPLAAPPNPDASTMLTEYLVDLGHGRSICLRGLNDDLQLITTSTWLRAKTRIDGYMEAAAKLIVYVVAALSQNMSQAGAIIFMGLLLVTAGLLGLSNSHAQSFQMHGKMATVGADEAEKKNHSQDMMAMHCVDRMSEEEPGGVIRETFPFADRVEFG